jgi:hypothetical protein
MVDTKATPLTRDYPGKVIDILLFRKSGTAVSKKLGAPYKNVK